MIPNTIYSVCALVASVGWCLLVFRPKARWAAPLIVGVVIPTMLAVVYAAVLSQHLGDLAVGFGSLDAVSRLFENPWMLVAGWVHYFAFDLFVGAWMVRDAIRYQIPHLLVVPFLLLTFLLGPVGLIAYLGLRFARMRTVRLNE